MPTDNAFVDAMPTKEFFIDMLVKDIYLRRAILDLVDNSLDGAKRLRPEGDYTDLAIKLNVTADEFSISDNCGGIALEIARQYAFRFGRPKDMPKTASSVGQFGVGMKRAIFKMGRVAHIESKAQSGSFILDIDVDEWIKEDDWHFRFDTVDDTPQEAADSGLGTILIVRRLHDSVRHEFSVISFLPRLRDEIEQAHQYSLQQGLLITLNGTPLRSSPAELLNSAELKPAVKHFTFNEDQGQPVFVSIYCGLADSDPKRAGWYIYCNNRLVVGADQSNLTGWGEESGETIPKYHNQYARFRGYVTFLCEESSKLPWNTTKTGVDVDSDAFQRVRLDMITLMRGVIDFLNKVAAEKEPGKGDPTPLERALLIASRSKLKEISYQGKFIAPRPVIPPAPPTTGTIKYSRTLTEIQKVQMSLGASSYKEVGERTFDYYMRMECE